jgi:hypothetical protein
MTDTDDATIEEAQKRHYLLNMGGKAICGACGCDFKLCDAASLCDIATRRGEERDSALNFLRSAAYAGKEIVSTCRLSELNIANHRACGSMYVEPGGGLGWVVRNSNQFEACSEQLHRERDALAEEVKRLRSLKWHREDCPCPCIPVEVRS